MRVCAEIGPPEHQIEENKLAFLVVGPHVGRADPELVSDFLDVRDPGMNEDIPVPCC